ncbi:MAG TPA: Hsp70 family protein [Candidatus Dormibacteraeota bacterium]
MNALGCGIDFGTSNSAIAVAWPDRVQVVAVEPASPTLPSIVYLHRDGERRAGREAADRFFTTGHLRTSCGQCSLAPYGVSECLQFRRDGGCNDARLINGVKHDLAKPGFTGTNSWCTDFPVAELVAVVMGRLKAAAERVTGERLERVVLGHPVVFAGARDAEAQAEGLARLRRAAELVGFQEIGFLPEPQAALAAAPRRGVALAVDFGGGTFDAALLVDGEVRALAGTPVGGERLDQVIFETRVGPELGLDALPNWLFNEMRSLSGVGLLLTDPGLPFLLERFGGPAARTARAVLFEGHAHDFYRSIERAKITLSDQETALAEFQRPGIRMQVPLHRGFFEASIRPELDAVQAVITEVLARGGLDAAAVDTVISTGGSSQIPAFQRRLETLFGAARIEHRDAFTSVVEGLGQAARSATPAASGAPPGARPGTGR